MDVPDYIEENQVNGILMSMKYLMKLDYVVRKFHLHLRAQPRTISFSPTLPMTLHSFIIICSLNGWTCRQTLPTYGLSRGRRDLRQFA
jgi:hypothetical protein